MLYLPDGGSNQGRHQRSSDPMLYLPDGGNQGRHQTSSDPMLYLPDGGARDADLHTVDHRHGEHVSQRRHSGYRRGHQPKGDKADQHPKARMAHRHEHGAADLIDNACLGMDDEDPHELAEDGGHLMREAISMPSVRRHDEHHTLAGEGRRRKASTSSSSLTRWLRASTVGGSSRGTLSAPTKRNPSASSTPRERGAPGSARPRRWRQRLRAT